MLGELYKQAGFLLQAKHFLETGEDLTRPRELLPRLGEEDRTVLEGRERAAALSGPETPPCPDRRRRSFAPCAKL